MSPKHSCIKSCEENACESASSFYKTHNLPKRFDHPGYFSGYGVDRDVHFAYQTSNFEYGKFPPSIHTVPLRYYPYNYELSRSLLVMRKRNASLNM